LAHLIVTPGELLDQIVLPGLLLDDFVFPDVGEVAKTAGSSGRRRASIPGLTEFVIGLKICVDKITDTYP
jgi:hypothetical protein